MKLFCIHSTEFVVEASAFSIHYLVPTTVLLVYAQIVHTGGEYLLLKAHMIEYFMIGNLPSMPQKSSKTITMEFERCLIMSWLHIRVICWIKEALIIF